MFYILMYVCMCMYICIYVCTNVYTHQKIYAYALQMANNNIKHCKKDYRYIKQDLTFGGFVK